MATNAVKALVKDAQRRVLDMIFRAGEPIVLVDSPPGAGKTSLIQDVTATGVHHVGLKIGICAPKNEQAFEIVRRLMEIDPDVPLEMLLSNKTILPGDLEGYVQAGRIHRVGNPEALRRGAGVVVGTVDKFNIEIPSFPQKYFDVLICEEVYQVPFAKFSPLPVIAQQILMVGDPGQLPPYIKSDTSSFEGGAIKPHWPAPKQLLAMYPELKNAVVKLPVTWRLPQDTVDLIQPAFYPDLPFRSAHSGADRSLVLGASGLRSPIDRALDKLASGESIVCLVAPPRASNLEEFDLELAELSAAVIERLLERIPSWDSNRPLGPADFGVVDPHVASCEHVRSRLRRASIGGETMVETPEIWQGLQRPVMVAKHPLSGVPRLSQFELDPGRWCVMLSRHQLGCVIVTRDGVGEALEGHLHDSGERPGGAEDRIWQGWRAHLTLWRELKRLDRLIKL